jgi:hypothetical protein
MKVSLLHSSSLQVLSTGIGALCALQVSHHSTRAYSLSHPPSLSLSISTADQGHAHPDTPLLHPSLHLVMRPFLHLLVRPFLHPLTRTA